MMQKNDHLVFEHWWKWHASLFGPSNLYVVDNGSTDYRSIRQLEEAEQAGLMVSRNFNLKADFERKGEILSSLAHEVKDRYDFLMFLDCDEFLATRTPDGVVSCSKADIEKGLEPLMDHQGVIRISGAFLNVPGSTSAFYFWSDHFARKVFFAARWFANVDLGFHEGSTTKMAEPTISSLLHIHCQNKPYRDLLESAREKLIARVQDFEPETLKNYNGPGAHLARYFLRSEEEYMQTHAFQRHEHIECFPSRLAELGLDPPYLSFGVRALPSRGRDENGMTGEVTPMLSMTGNAGLMSGLQLRMTGSEAVLFKSFLGCSRRYMEFGSGGSTCLAADLVHEWVISVDSSASWVSSVAETCEKRGSKPPTLLHIDIGPTKEWGYPADDLTRSLWPSYHTDVWSQTAAAEADLFLVDGRFRVACFLQIMLRCSSTAFVAVHDFASRIAYEIMQHFGTPVAEIEDLTVFRRRLELQVDELHNSLTSYHYDPQ